MKKMCLLFIITLAIFSNFYSQPLIYSFKEDGIKIDYDLNSEFMLSHISPFTQSAYKLDSLIAIGLSGGQRKSVFTYDGQKLIVAQQSFLDGNIWILDDRVILAYNDQGQTAEIKLQSLREDSTWSDYNKQTYEYNEENKLISYLTESFINGSWNNSHRSLFSYPNNDEEIISQHFDSSNWVNNTLIHTYIGDNGNLDSTFVYKWEDTSWSEYLRWYRHYNEFNKWDYVIAKQWFNSSWTTQASMEGIYDGDGNLAKVNYYDWSNQFEELKSRLIYSYDNEGNLIEVFNEYKTVDGWFPAQVDPIVIDITEDYTEGYLYNKVKLYYSPISSVNDDELYADFTLHQNYPNPFNPNTTIKFSIPHSQFATLKVYDILGRKIKTLLNKPMQPGSYEIEFDGRNLTSGVYFYVLEAGGKRLSKKMLLIK